MTTSRGAPARSSVDVSYLKASRQRPLRLAFLIWGMTGLGTAKQTGLVC